MPEQNTTDQAEVADISLATTCDAVPIDPATDTNETTSDDQMEDKETREQPHSPSAPVRIFSLLLEYLELFVTCLCVIMIAFSLFFRICSVSGHSMLPTLKDGELLLVSDLFYDPAPGDIIIFHQTSDEVSRFNEPIVKRVIATEGQRVYIDFTDGYVEVDGIRLKEDYIQLVDPLGIPTGKYDLFAEHNFRMEPQADGETHRIFEAIVPKGELFVMGDNRNNSSDSRTKVIGFVDERRILGHVLCRMSLAEGFVPVN